jgi:hypothetical protein
MIVFHILIGGFNMFQPPWKICSSDWIIIPTIGENKKLKNVPTSIYTCIYIIIYSWWWFMVFLAKRNAFKKNGNRWSRTKWCGDYIFEVMMFRCLQRILQISRMNHYLYLSIHPLLCSTQMSIYQSILSSIWIILSTSISIHLFHSIPSGNQNQT